MKINQLSLQNFRGFEHLEINFKNQVSVIIGTNGAGKSSVLDAIGVGLIRIIAGLSKRFGLFFIDTRDIKKGETTYDINIDVSLKNIHTKVSVNPTTHIHHEEIEIDNLIVDMERIYPALIFYGNRVVTGDGDKNYPFYENFGCPLDYSFEEFFEWFEDEEQYENQKRLDNDFDYRSPNLEYVRETLQTFLSHLTSHNYSKLKIKYIREEEGKPLISYMSVNKNEEEFDITQLSSGEKRIILLVTDIAKRALTANKDKQGIVLIDEIDQHLHPSWQREVLPALAATFPNLQFIATTHSPLVLSKLEKESVFMLEDNKLVQETPNTFGREANTILYEVFGVNARPKEVQQKIDACFVAIELEEWEKASSLLEELKKLLGENDSDVIMASVSLSTAQLLDETN